MKQYQDEHTRDTIRRWGARKMVLLSMIPAIGLVVRAINLRPESMLYLDISLMWFAIMLLVAIGATASGPKRYGGNRSKVWRMQRKTISYRHRMSGYNCLDSESDRLYKISTP